jgi:hypothetical protein
MFIVRVVKWAINKQAKAAGIAARQGFDSRQCKILLFSTASRPALGPTQSSIQWVLWGGTLSLEVKWMGREADRSPSASAELKNGEVTSPPLMVWSLIKYRKNSPPFLIKSWRPCELLMLEEWPSWILFAYKMFWEGFRETCSPPPNPYGHALA